MSCIQQDIKKVSKSLANRKAGRPKSSQLQGDALKEHVVNAASLVYGEWGFHESSVEKIVKAAGISRPLFYRLFDNKEDIIDVVVQQKNTELIMATQVAIEPLNNIMSILDAGIDVYFKWCKKNRLVVKAIYREINDPLTPACKQYQQTIDTQLANYFYKFKQIALPPLQRELFLALTKTVEYVANETIKPGQQDKDYVEMQQNIARRIVFATLASSEEITPISPQETILSK